MLLDAESNIRDEKGLFQEGTAPGPGPLKFKVIEPTKTVKADYLPPGKKS
jgi:hypothetical protein